MGFFSFFSDYSQKSSYERKKFVAIMIMVVAASIYGLGFIFIQPIAPIWGMGPPFWILLVFAAFGGVLLFAAKKNAPTGGPRSSNKIKERHSSSRTEDYACNS